MLNLNLLDEDISAYYDDEMNPSKLLEYEARMALSDCVRDYTNEKCFEYFKISGSILRVSKRLNKAALLEYRMFLTNRKREEDIKKSQKNIFDRFFSSIF